MNFYDKHIGDFIRDTVGLSMIEDGAYNRLLDQLYQTERALPLEKKEVYRMARATSAPERKAVDYVLGKFFQSTAEGYTQKRAQAQIEEFWDRAPATESKKENAKIRQQRSRDRRKSLFDMLRELGVTPEFNASMRTLEQALSRVTKRDESQSGHAIVTRDDTLTQTPLPTSQSPDLKTKADDDATDSGREDDDRLPPRPQHGAAVDPTTRATEIATLLRAAGVAKVTAFHPDVAVTWAQNERVTDQLLASAVALAKESKGDVPIPIGYLKPIIAELLNPPEAKAAKPKSDDWEWKRSDGGIERKGREMGMFARGGESYRDFAGRIDDEIRKRKGKP